MADPTSAERLAGHRAGYSTPMQKRLQGAATENFQDSSEQLVFRSSLPTIATALVTADVAYWVYVGRTARPVTAANVCFRVGVVAVGTQAAEVAIASGSAPNAAAQTLTVLAVDATLSDLTSGTGVKKNTTSLAYVIPQLTHVWLGLRVNMTSSPTQPSIYGHTFDCSNGEILSTATAGVLAAGSSYTGALITDAVTWQAPALFLRGA